MDYGTVRIGVAICDENQSIASPLETYSRRNERLDADYFERLTTENSLVGFVVGLPIHMSGDESEKSLEARSFGKWLTDITKTPVVWVDERYSTAFARQMLSGSNLSSKKRKVRLDKVAAQAILMTYLESRDNSGSNLSLVD